MSPDNKNPRAAVTAEMLLQATKDMRSYTGSTLRSLAMSAEMTRDDYPDTRRLLLARIASKNTTSNTIKEAFSEIMAGTARALLEGVVGLSKSTTGQGATEACVSTGKAAMSHLLILTALLTALEEAGITYRVRMDDMDNTMSQLRDLLAHTPPPVRMLQFDMVTSEALRGSGPLYTQTLGVLLEDTPSNINTKDRIALAAYHYAVAGKGWAGSSMASMIMRPLMVRETQQEVRKITYPDSASALLVALDAAAAQYL